MKFTDYLPVILGVLKDFRVIGTVIVMLIVIEFAKFITSYKKRPPRPKKEKGKKAAPAPAPAPAQEPEADK